MFCMKCGQNLPDDAAFCSKCGNKVGQATPSSNKELIHLKCGSCGGSMSVDADRPVLTCPYCGAADLINESDRVTIQRVKSKAYREVQLGQQQTEKDIELAKLQAAAKREKANNILFLVCVLIVLIPIAIIILKEVF